MTEYWLIRSGRHVSHCCNGLEQATNHLESYVPNINIFILLPRSAGASSFQASRR